MVARSIEAPGGARCVDVFRRRDGLWGFEEYRRDAEDGRGWFQIGGNDARAFGSEAEGHRRGAGNGWLAAAGLTPDSPARGCERRHAWGRSTASGSSTSPGFSAGPFCTQWLGDHGADVIKIEPPQGDEVRHWGPPFDEEVGAASYFLGINRNKRGMALDLGSDQGREVLLRLLETADVLIENFKPGGMERWGLGYDTLGPRFPRLVHCRISGFGADGPLGGLPGYDAVVQAQAGLMSVNGVAGGQPTRLGIPIVDIATGMSAGLGIAMALYEREKSGKGQFIDATLYDTAVSVLFPHYANYFLSGRHPVLTGNNHPQPLTL